MKKLLLTTAATLALTAPAWAGTFEADTFTVLPGFADVAITSPKGETVEAGEIRLTTTATNTNLDVWCLDVLDLLAVPYTFQVNNYTAGDIRPGLNVLDGSQVRQVASLMARGLSLGGPDADLDDAATQLAIWKTVYGALFSVTGLSANLQARFDLEFADSQAGGSLDCPGCTLTVLTDAVTAPNQALGFAVVPVPGPIVGAGLPGLLAGFSMLGVYWKRRKQTTAA